VWNPDVYPMSWAWITGNLTEHEMELEHGLELEKIKAEDKRQLVDFDKAVAVGGGRIYSLHREAGEKIFSIRRLYSAVKDLNDSIKNWKGD